MTYLDLTLPTPVENLACDEALLDFCEAGHEDEILRVWEPRDYFVVVGYANKVEEEVNVEACRKEGVPVFRRCSGGGTVLQGPGCLNYSLILKIENPNAPLQTVPQTNHYIMERQKQALQPLLGNRVAIEVKGHTDLALGELKFSGNAQRRKRHCLIFHGAFLIDFDIARIERLLRMPSREPDYRGGRSHKKFLTNLKLSSESVKEALRTSWGAAGVLQKVPDFQQLLKDKYSREEWNFKF